MKKYSSFPHAQHKHMEIMLKCLSICEACSTMCIDEGHKATAKLCEDCADVCALTIKLHSRDSQFNKKMMSLCASVCQKCADACAKMDAKHCQECSDICKKCADACKK